MRTIPSPMDLMMNGKNTETGAASAATCVDGRRAGNDEGARHALSSFVRNMITWSASKCRFGIGAKVAVLLCGGVLVTTVAVALMMSHRFGHGLVDGELKALAQSSKTVGTRLALWVETLEDDVLLMAGTPPIQGIIRAETAGGIDPSDGSSETVWKRRLETIFTKLLETKPHYLQVRYVSAQGEGREIVRVDRNRGPIRTVRSDELQSKGDREYMRKTRLLSSQGIYLSKVELNRENGRISMPQTPVLRAATPVYSPAGDVWGVVVVNMDMREAFADARSVLPAQTTLLIANENGDYILHPAPSYGMSFEHGAPHCLQDDLPEASSFIASPGKRSASMIGRHAGQEAAVGLYRMTTPEIDNSPTLIVATIAATSQILAPSRRIQRQTMWIAGLMTLASMFVGMLFAKTVTEPLRTMAVAASAFADGDDTVSLPSQAGDETGVLARTLEDMRHRIQNEAKGLKQQVARRRKAEARLREAHDQLEVRVSERTEELETANRQLAEFAYVASHDLKEPLRMVASFTTLLADEYQGKLDEQADRYIQYATSGAKRMQSMIDDLLDYSRIGRADSITDEVDLAAVVNDVVSNLDYSIQANQAAVETGTLPTVQGSATLLMQLFQNLVSNAIKFHGQEPPRVCISCRREEDDYVFAVADNGIGIPPAQHDRIFQMFQRLHGRGEYEGTGIGLAICRKIVEQHGGRMWIESQSGEGATFFFTLPAEPANQPTVTLEKAPS